LDTTTKELEYARLKISFSKSVFVCSGSKIRTGQREAKYLQLELLEQEPGSATRKWLPRSERQAPPVSEAKKKRKHPGRQTLPADCRV